MVNVIVDGKEGIQRKTHNNLFFSDVTGQSVHRRATGWAAEESAINSWQRQD
jgi:hypothetical protein